MAERETPNEQNERDEQHEADRKSKIIEQDPNDIPRKGQSQRPDINPGKAQPGHRDREQI
jgi:hypothetical protein